MGRRTKHIYYRHFNQRHLMDCFPESSGVYALRFKNGVKIGCSKNIQKRMDAYTTPWCLEILDTFFVKTEHYEVSEKLSLAECYAIWETYPGSTEFFYTTNFTRICRILTKMVESTEKQIAQVLNNKNFVDKRDERTEKIYETLVGGVVAYTPKVHLSLESENNNQQILIARCHRLNKKGDLRFSFNPKDITCGNCLRLME